MTRLVGCQRTAGGVMARKNGWAYRNIQLYPYCIVARPKWVSSRIVDRWWLTVPEPLLGDRKMASLRENQPVQR